MFHFLVGFTYVLYVLIRSTQSSSVLASFHERCSENQLCQFPLICSNSSECICSKSSSSWNEDFKDCFYCPTGWTAWENNHCLSFAVPTAGGLPYEQANATCQSFSGELFSINNLIELKAFDSEVNRVLRQTFSSAVSLYFRLGAWIDQSHIDAFEDVWCNDQKTDPHADCVYIRRNALKNNSLCLSQLNCQEEMPFICQITAISERYSTDDDQSETSDHRFLQLLAQLAPMAMNLLGGLFGGSGGQQPQQAPAAAPPPSPQQIIIQRDPTPAPQAASSDKTIWIIVGIVGGFILLIFCCVGIGLIIYCFFSSKNSRSRQANERLSVESASSNV